MVRRSIKPELIKSAYKILDLMSFLTTGEDETRGLELLQGRSTFTPRARAHIILTAIKTL